MEVRLLGPLELRHGDTTIDLGDRQRQHVLVVLILNANHAISTDQIIEIAWIRRPGNDVVRHHVSNIRAAFKAAGVPQDVASVDRVPAVGGYRLSIDQQCIDAERFRTLCTEAESAGDQRRQLDVLHAAVELWHGDYLEGIDIDRVGGTNVVSPYDAYLDAVGDLAELELRRHRHRWVRDLVRPVLAKDMTRQRLAALLMRALMANGDTTQAVEVFHDVRDALGDAGVQVSTELRRLVARATRQEPDSQLPEAVELVGRDDELEEIRSSILEAAGAGRPARIWISGPPGIGKSTLAVGVAHKLRPRCPDHQIHVDLNGFSPNVSPMSRFDALGDLLERLGVPPEQIPGTVDGRVNVYRSELAGTKSVVVLDNAASEQQLRELLPIDPGCVGLVTSRRAPGVESMATVRLDPLSTKAGCDLFATFLPASMAGRISGQDQLMVDVVTRCGGIPLQIRVVASRFRLHRSWSLEHLAALLQDVGAWQGGSLPGDVGRAAISVSYLQLPTAQRTLFRMLSSLPGPDLGVSAAAAVGHCSVRAARALLEELHAVSLIEEYVAERYRMLDPIKEIGATLPPDTPDEVPQAMDRLLDFYLVTTAAAMLAAFPFDRKRQPAVTRTSTVPLGFQDGEAAMDWLSAERRNLSAAIRYAVGHGRTEHVWQLAVLLWRWHYVRGQVADWTEALELAKAVLDVPGGDRHGLALVLHRLSGARWQVGKSDEALELAARALTISRSLGDPGGEAAALTSIALVNMRAGNHDSAVAHFKEALHHYQEADDLQDQAHALSNLGYLYDISGAAELAESSLTDAIALFTQLDHVVGLAHTLENRGCVRQRAGQFDRAVEDHEQARDLAIRMGDVAVEARAVNSIGRAHRGAGRLADALEMHDRAGELAALVTDPDLRVQLHIDRGATLMATEDFAGARDAYLAAYDFRSGDRMKQARAARGAAEALHAAGDCAAAAEYWRAAVVVFDELGVREAAEVRTERAGFDCSCATD